MRETNPFNIYNGPQPSSASTLIVGWDQDAGRLGARVIDFLISNLAGREFAEIEPVGFFPLDGVQVEADVATFPASKFYYCDQNNLVLFKSALPMSEWYRFLDTVLHIAETYGNVKEMYTVGGMVSFAAHTADRGVFGLPNSPEMKQTLQGWGLVGDMDYETPPGQGTTLNSFLLWVAKRRGLAGAGIWTAVPFYLAQMEDPQACKKVIEFLDDRFNLRIDFRGLDEEIGQQHERIARLRSRLPEIDDYIRSVESNVGLTEHEMESLVASIQEHLSERG
ncbi:PAC2 family protein [Chloroflexota bacterium]